jgi:hypothetical protein
MPKRGAAKTAARRDADAAKNGAKKAKKPKATAAAKKVAKQQAANAKARAAKAKLTPRKKLVLAPQAKQKKRLRYGALPSPDAQADLYWGIYQPELRGLTDAELVKLILDSPEFEAVLGSKLDEIDTRNRTLRGTKVMGRPSRWNARQLEAVLIYRRCTGTSTIKRARARLEADPSAQLLLGLGKAVPSEPTITRYLTQHFDPDERRDLYRELDRQLRHRIADLPGFDKECQKLGMDGSKHETRYTAPIPVYDKNGDFSHYDNEDIPKGDPGAITAPDAGFVGKGNPKSGKGWQFVGLFSEHGTLLAWDISKLNSGEPQAAARVLDDYEREILPRRSKAKISVCSTDGGFNSAELRARLQELGIAPNIHKASHAKAEVSLANVAELSRNWQPFEYPGKPHYRNWVANGHDEIRCQCGQGKTERVFKRGKRGGVLIATRGVCSTCGDVRITAGRWRRAQNPDRFVLAVGGSADPSIGNPLTFHDQLANEYGRDRFGWNESIHATLHRRFGLLNQSWMRSKTQVETEFAITASAISVLLLERARVQASVAKAQKPTAGKAAA